jgi:ABC-type uncharacterized transport system substrate-binding protein
MWFVVKRLSLGLILIALMSSLLLVSDWSQRQSSGNRIPRMALLQYSSQPILVEGIEGALDALRERGFIDGQTVSIKRYNAEGDVATVNAIAREITGGQFDMVMTMSTPAMQAVANANKDGKTIHVFGLVADPFGAGVGISRENPLDHPKHLTGFGSFLPVIDAFELAKKSLPNLKSVGVVWNPGESNSQAFTLKAREACRQLGIELMEANADNSSAVVEAVNSLISRGVQSLWVGGDNTVLLAINSVISVAQKARIPVFTITPGDPKRGTLFELGANFYEIGKVTGLLAADVFQGTSPATVPVRNVIPKKLIVNKLALEGLKDPWQLPDDVVAGADIVVDETGVHDKTASRPSAAADTSKPLTKKWKISLIQYVSVVDVEETEEGVKAGLRESGLIEGRDYALTIRNAQGDMATVNSLIDAATTEGSDLLITMSTPTLQAALQRARNTPIVFTYLANAVAAGAGRSDEDHLPNVTGVYMMSAYDELMAIIRQLMPSARRVGSLFVPAETNMVFHKEKLEEAGRKAGIEVVTMPANTSAEVPDAALALMSQKLDAVCQMPGNLSAAAFPSIASAARKARLPVFVFQTSQVRSGALLALSRDYFECGRESALIAARVMRGADPAKMPFVPLGKTRLIVNLDAARELKLTLPPALVKQAAEVIGK